MSDVISNGANLLRGFWDQRVSWPLFKLNTGHVLVKLTPPLGCHVRPFSRHHLMKYTDAHTIFLPLAPRGANKKEQGLHSRVLRSAMLALPQAISIAPKSPSNALANPPQRGSSRAPQVCCSSSSLKTAFCRKTDESRSTMKKWATVWSRKLFCTNPGKYEHHSDDSRGF